jgi:HEAT repeat protein
MLRQGELKDKRAIPELIVSLTNDLDWKLNQSAADAIVAIGGNEAEGELIKLMGHPDENRVRRHASEAAFQLLGDRSRSLAIRVLTENEFGWKPAAYQTLGKVGTSDDLSLLLSLSDYWTGDRPNHYWAMSALSAVRERVRYDVNGPIIPAR